MMELGDTSNKEAPHHAQGIKRCGNICSCKLLKGSTWHTAQYINYGSAWHAHMPWVILFLWKLIPRKELQDASYISKRVCPGGCQGCPTAEEVYPKKTCDIDGGIKDNCASLDCWFDQLCSL